MLQATVKLAGTFNLLKGPSLEKIEVTKTALDNLQLLDTASSGLRDINQVNLSNKLLKVAM